MIEQNSLISNSTLSGCQSPHHHLWNQIAVFGGQYSFHVYSSELMCCQYSSGFNIKDSCCMLAISYLEHIIYTSQQYNTVQRKSIGTTYEVTLALVKILLIGCTKHHKSSASSQCLSRDLSDHWNIVMTVDFFALISSPH